MVMPFLAEVVNSTPIDFNNVPYLAGLIALWRQHTIDVQRNQANIERMAESAHATRDAMDALTRALQGNHDAAKSA